MSKKNYISLAKKSADLQIKELKKIKKTFNKSFETAVELILNCKGKVIFAGVGKSGLIARKISATFSSVGIPSFFCDPAQALHGDMGQIQKKDILIIFSYSGNTSELTNMLKYANRYRIKIIGVASKPDSIIKNRYIKGLVTDGDLRRELKHYSKNENLEKFMTKTPLVVNENMPSSKALAIMNEKKITSLLVVSDKDLKKKNKILKGIIHIHFLLQNGI